MFALYNPYYYAQARAVPAPAPTACARPCVRRNVVRVQAPAPRASYRHLPNRDYQIEAPGNQFRLERENNNLSVTTDQFSKTFQFTSDYDVEATTYTTNTGKLVVTVPYVDREARAAARREAEQQRALKVERARQAREARRAELARRQEEARQARVRAIEEAREARKRAIDEYNSRLEAQRLQAQEVIDQVMGNPEFGEAVENIQKFVFLLFGEPQQTKEDETEPAETELTEPETAPVEGSSADAERSAAPTPAPGSPVVVAAPELPAAESALLLVPASPTAEPVVEEPATPSQVSSVSSSPVLVTAPSPRTLSSPSLEQVQDKEFASFNLD